MKKTNLKTITMRQLTRYLAGDKNVLLEGVGGSGKTTAILRYLKRKRKKLSVLILAPTGLASTKYDDGRTIHSALNLPCTPLGPDYRITDTGILDDIDLLIIDEISMVRLDVYHCIRESVKEHEASTGHHIRIIMLGDTQQLAPVITSKDREKLNELWREILPHGIGSGHFFKSPSFDEDEFVHLFLPENLRNPDDEFNKALNKMREGDPECIDYFNQFYSEDAQYYAIFPHLTFTRELSRQINQAFIRYYSGGDTTTYFAFSPDKCSGWYPTSSHLAPYYPVDLCMELFVGERVMTIQNTSHYKNGLMGTIVELTDSAVFVTFDNGQKAVKVTRTLIGHNADDEYIEGESDLKQFILQFPLVPAYSMTFHKSQAQTFPQAVIHLEGACMPGLVYTAISRIACTDGLYLADKLTPKMVHAFHIYD